MKVIVTGATGFVGREVVVQCIANSDITSVIVITRREIDVTLSQNPKVRVILHNNFEDYPSDLLQQLEEAEGCIWCLGGKVEDFPDLETARKVGVDYSLAAARAFATGICPSLQERGRRFLFVFCSGKGAEWDQSKSLWLFSDTRKLKGAAERGLLDIAEENPDVFDTLVLRPGGVTPDANVLLAKIAGVMVPVVPVSQLAKALVRVCINPPQDKVVENDGILKLAGE
ncbi:hypothetical protein H2200_004351 [Cladophialophora chaetospira]|uniref:NAD(P)-binding domain-containing protein n=1 Tax=Cladophialophora chaetospira TaxID=386627 RepID=A0AA38XCZ4_9EURO|nr:hypothetical protein H2200_004351 [Cladophialophora chaetospira]